MKDRIVHALRTDLDRVQFTDIRLRLRDGVDDYGVLEVKAVYEHHDARESVESLRDRRFAVRDRLRGELREMGFMPLLWLRYIPQSEWDEDPEFRDEWETDPEFL